MAILKIPYEFITQHVRTSWSDVLFGIKHQLTAPSSAIDKAKEISLSKEILAKQESELASLARDETVLDLVAQLAQAEPPSLEEEASRKRLYLVLAWLYDNRERVTDPLSIVEEVYADFDYPKEIAPFVRYMPMVGPDLGGKEQNEQRLFNYWKEYLDQAGEHWNR